MIAALSRPAPIVAAPAAVPAPRPRPTCSACGKLAPTINGRCVSHMELATEVWLYTVSAEDASAS